MPPDGRSDRTVSTGGLTVGRYVMDVGAPEGMTVRRVRLRGAPPPELVEALAEEARPPLAAAEEAIEDANEVAAKVDHAATLFTKVAKGEIDVATIAGELDRLFALLSRLDRAGRYEEALRLARVLARLLALATRLVALVGTLRIAVHAAEALADSKALAWALHELGALALGADDAEAAERDLGEARRLREQDGDQAGLAATEHNLRYVARGGLLSSRALRVGGGAVALAVVLVLVVVAVTGDDDDPERSQTPTPTGNGTETAQPTPGDETAPMPTLAADELTNERTPALSGTAGTEEGDRPDVTVRIYEGAEVAGDPLQERPATRGDDGRFEVLAAPLASGTYTAQAEQADEAGNTGRSDAVTFSVDLDPPSVTIAEPANETTTGELPEFSGTAGQADGDEPVVRLTVPSGTQSIDVQPDGTWSREVAVPGQQDPDTGDYASVTATAEQSDEAGNVGSATVTFTPTPPDVER
jgi:hypothetical protein